MFFGEVGNCLGVLLEGSPKVVAPLAELIAKFLGIVFLLLKPFDMSLQGIDSIFEIACEDFSPTGRAVRSSVLADDFEHLFGMVTISLGCFQPIVESSETLAIEFVIAVLASPCGVE